MTPTSSAPKRSAGILALAAVCLIGVLLASRGLTDESAVSLDGDMPHYLLNGVFFHDLIKDFPLGAPVEYAKQYYARYPALTLGHHPFLPSLIEVPFFSAFGVSVFSGRLSVLAALILALAFWFWLVQDIYDTPTAFFSSLLLISTPGVIPLFQVVLSEPYALSLIILSVFFMHRYCATERAPYAFAFGVSVVLSGYAKQLALFIVPVYLFQFVRAFGFGRLLKRSTLLMAAGIVLCLLPLVPLTMRFSQFNVAVVTQFVGAGVRTSSSRLLRFVRGLWTGQFRLTVPLLVVAAMAALGATIKRDGRFVLFALWIGVVYLGLVSVSVFNDRFFCYWLPPFCALAAASYQLSSSRAWRATSALLLTAIVGYQAWVGVGDLSVPRRGAIRVAGAAGYEEGARYVVDHRRGDTVLYSAGVDTGYFVFFVRKHDPEREMIVLRADKVLTTSRMRRLDFARQLNHPDEILPLLQRYGVGYVVLEDRTYPEGPLLWLQHIVQTPDFERRRQIPIASQDTRLANVTLSIYEYLGAVPADRDASLAMNIPLMNSRIQVRLGDLIKPAP